MKFSHFPNCVVWNDRSISLTSKIRLMRSLVTSIFLYACESWTLTAELQRRIRAMETKCYRKILHSSYKDHVTNEEVRARIQQATGPHEDLLTIVQRRKLKWYGHVSRSLGWPKPSCEAQRKEEENNADRKSGYIYSFLSSSQTAGTIHKSSVKE